MREIKFRAYMELESGQIIKVENTLDSIKKGYPMLGVCERLIAWVQYTCLNDKHNNEIYEGDILNFQMPTMDKPVKKLVEECGACFWLKPIGYIDGTIPMYIYMSDKIFEIIGNIYENPELLEIHE